VKVYLSSSYKDLREHRAAVALTLRRMGHDVIGMEEYVAEGVTPLARSLADVESADVYVVMVGWRYGHVPADSAANPAHRSITELEFERATASGTPVLAFLLDPEAPWPPTAVDALTETGGAEVLRFRSLLGGSYLSGMFTTPDNVASQAAAAIAAQGINRHMVDRALGQTRVSGDMAAFARGDPLVDTGTAAIRQMVADAGTTRALVLNIGAGGDWWSTRLYLLAALTQSLTGIRQFVFTYADGSFAGMATPAAVRERLCAAFQEIANFDTALRLGASTLDLDREMNRVLELWAQQLAPLEPNLKVGVRWPLLVDWLGERLVTRCIEIDAEAGPTMTQVQQLVDSLLPDVPLQQHAVAKPAPDVAQPQLMVVDRDAFALELAREWVRSGVPRSPVR
jgi:hypothetical protein